MEFVWRLHRIVPYGTPLKRYSVESPNKFHIRCRNQWLTFTLGSLLQRTLRLQGDNSDPKVNVSH